MKIHYIPFLSVFLSLLALEVHAISFMLAANVRRCLKDEIHKDVLVTGDFKLSDAGGGHSDKTTLSASILHADLRTDSSLGLTLVLSWWCKKDIIHFNGCY